MGIEVLLGVELVGINCTDTEITFTTKNGEQYLMHHEQDCCESVTVEDVCGNLEDLLYSPIIRAEEVSSRQLLPEYINSEELAKAVFDRLTGRNEDNDMSETWTFYKLDTAKGGVTIRWYGTSNGYYSEQVDFVKLT
jgi:hypothetical protein